MSKTKKKKKFKGKAYKRITFDSGNVMATMYSLWQRGNHHEQNTDHSCELLDTIETFATENLDGEGEVVGMRFPKEGAEMVVSMGLHEYMPNFFKTLSPPGAMSRDFKKLKQAAMDAEKVFDKELIEGDWTLEDSVWFSPEALHRPKSEGEDENETEDETKNDDDESGDPAEEADEPAGDDDAGDVSDDDDDDDDAEDVSDNNEDAA